jgi:hypothetical protein
MKHSLARQPHPTQQVGEARIGADVVESWCNAEEDQQADALLISRFEELKRLVFLAQVMPTRGSDLNLLLTLD